MIRHGITNCHTLYLMNNRIRPCLDHAATPSLQAKDNLHAAAPTARRHLSRSTGARLLSASLLTLGLSACGSGDSPEHPESLSSTQGDNPIAALARGLDNDLAITDTSAPATSEETAGHAAQASAAAAPSAESQPAARHLSTRAVNVPASTDVCRTVVAQNSVLRTGMDNARIPGLPRPGWGRYITDPNYGTCVARVTGNVSMPNQPYVRNDYSRRQAFNANDTYMLMAARDGYWFLYDALTMKRIRRLAGPAGDAEPQWHPTNPNLLYFLNRNGIGMQIHVLDVRTNQRKLASDMGPHVRKIWPGATTAWTRSEGAPSADGRYWCFQAETRNWNTVGVFTWDMKEQRIVGSMDVHERPDHVSMTPSGRYCVISSDGSLGTRAYTRDFRSPYFPERSSQPWLRLHHKSEHSDIAFDRNGVDTYVAVDYQAGEVFSVNLQDGRRKSLFPVYPGRTATAMHFSGKAYKKPGWVLVSTYAEYHADNMYQPVRNTDRQQWLHRKMFAVSLDDRTVVRPIAHIDSTLASAPGFDAYWSEPHASVNASFTRMLFNSTWNSSNPREVETYLVALPKRALDR